MNITQQQEQLSLAFVCAVAAVAGITVAVDSVDDDSIDLTLKSRDTRGATKRPMFEIQLKATALNDRLKDDALHFPLKLKNYNDLRGEDNMIPRVLVVMVHPKEVKDWLEQTEEELLMRHTAYWVSLRDDPETENKVTVTVKLPRAQMFTPESLLLLMQRLAGGRQP